MKKLTAAQARQIDLVDWLATLGHQPKKIRNQDYWYFSPFRQEATPSFKVNRAKNVWFDFGEGKGGNLVDFGIRYFQCPVSELLEKLHQQQSEQSLSFHRQPPAGEKKAPDEGKILILGERALSAKSLLQYLQDRCIPVDMAEHFCREVDFLLYSKKYTAIGFRNDAGGYELRNQHFKGSSSPKQVTFYNNGQDQLAVFEGFFSFLSYQTIRRQQVASLTNFLILNSLSFFQQARQKMEEHRQVSLFLDRDKAGIKCLGEAIGWDKHKYIDGSKEYDGCKDLNEWLMQNNLNNNRGLRIGGHF